MNWKETLKFVIIIGTVIGGFIFIDDRNDCKYINVAELAAFEGEIVATMQQFRGEIQQNINRNARDRLYDRRRDLENEAADIRWKLRERPGDVALGRRLNDIERRIADVDRRLGDL